jgi:hypothetical protein
MRSIVQRVRWTSLADRVRNPVFIIGSTRSGKTLIRSLLEEHPDVAAFPGEANYLWHPETHPWVYSRYRGQLPPYWAAPSIYTAKSLELRRPRHGDHIRTVFGAFCWWSGHKIFVNESAKITFLVPYILSLFPDARFVNVLRNGRCVAYLEARKVTRQLNAKRWVYTDHGFAMPFEDVLARCARAWIDHVAEAERLRSGASPLPVGRFLDLRYEEFFESPREQLRRICEFVGADPGAIPDPLPIDVSNRNWEVEMCIEAEAREILDDLLGTKCAECGYL